MCPKATKSLTYWVSGIPLTGHSSRSASRIVGRSMRLSTKDIGELSRSRESPGLSRSGGSRTLGSGVGHRNSGLRRNRKWPLLPPLRSTPRRKRLDIEMLSDILMLAGEGDRVGNCAAIQVAQVQVTELVESNAFSPSAPNTMQQMESETSAITDGELVRTI